MLRLKYMIGIINFFIDSVVFVTTEWKIQNIFILLFI